ncbi:hypothetical protein CA233_20260 [Sphingomonas sp. ABOLD]|nr:hypothetical protein CA233_20260 [Sphingomonas sp. ABOLD]
MPGLPIKGLGTVTATPPMAMGASGDQSGTTYSAIANGTITITSGDAASAALAQTIRRDTSGANAGAVVQQFDEAKRQEIAQGFQAAQALAAETTAFLSHQAAEAEKWAEEHPNRDPKSNPYAIWGAGGAGRLVLTAINGAAGSDVSGSLTSLVQGAAVNVLQGLATSKVKDIADKLHSEEARAALQGLVGCAGSAAGGSGDCASGAMGAAAAVVLNDLLKTGKTTATDKDGKQLTLAEQQARDNLVATIVAAVASAAGLDAQSAVTSAHLETQNNSTTTPMGLYSPDGKHGLPVAEVYEKDPAFREAVNKLGGLSAFDKVSACANAKEMCTLSSDQQAALDAYSLGNQNVVGKQREAEAAAALAKLASLGFTPAQIEVLATSPGSSFVARYTPQLGAAINALTKLKGPYGNAAIVGAGLGLGAAYLYVGLNTPSSPSTMTPVDPSAKPNTETLPVATPLPPLQGRPPMPPPDLQLGTPIPNPDDIRTPPLVTPIPPPPLPGFELPEPANTGGAYTNVAHSQGDLLSGGGRIRPRQVIWLS